MITVVLLGREGERKKERKVKKEFAIKFVQCQAETDGNEGGKRFDWNLPFLLPRNHSPVTFTAASGQNANKLNTIPNKD